MPVPLIIIDIWNFNEGYFNWYSPNLHLMAWPPSWKAHGNAIHSRIHKLLRRIVIWRGGTYH
jgi:hypothetical protein